jgi:hypothetical protein
MIIKLMELGCEYTATSDNPAPDAFYIPRKAENPTTDTKDGRNAKALMIKYGLAKSMAGLPAERRE